MFTQTVQSGLLPQLNLSASSVIFPLTWLMMSKVQVNNGSNQGNLVHYSSKYGSLCSSPPIKKTNLKKKVLKTTEKPACCFI